MSKYTIAARMLRLLPPALPIPKFLLDAVRVQFRVETTFTDATAILHCYGRIHAQEALALADAVVLLLSRRAIIILNLAGVKRLDTGGLGTLVLLHYYLRSVACSLRLCNLVPCIKDAIERTQLNSLFDIYGTEEDANAA
jgi:anti-anti-sigma factor